MRNIDKLLAGNPGTYMAVTREMLRLNPYPGRTYHICLGLNFNVLPSAKFLSNAFFMAYLGTAPEHECFQADKAIWKELGWQLFSKGRLGDDDITIQVLPFLGGFMSTMHAGANHDISVAAYDREKMHDLFYPVANKVLEHQHPEITDWSFRCGTVEAPMIQEILNKFSNLVITVRAPK